VVIFNSTDCIVVVKWISARLTTTTTTTTTTRYTCTLINYLPITSLWANIPGKVVFVIIPRWKNDGRELFLGGKTTGGNYS